MAELVFRVIAEPQLFATEPQIHIPVVAAVAPVGVPRERLRGMAEKFHLHLFELARAKREVPWSDFIAEALARLRDAERHLDANRVDHVLEVDKHSLRRFGAEEGRVFFAAQCPKCRLEHQIEFARLSELALVVFAGMLTWFERAFACFHMIDAKPRLARPAIDHKVVKQVVMPRAFPHLRVHNDRAIETDHRKGLRRAGRRRELVVVGDHVAPPRVFDVALQLDAQGSVIPEAVEAPVDFRRLVDESAPFAQRDDFVHCVVHGSQKQVEGVEESKGIQDERR